MYLIPANFIYCPANGGPGAHTPIGQWREHLPYNSAIDVTAGDGKVYCATPTVCFR